MAPKYPFCDQKSWPKTMFKIFYRSDLNTTQALHEIEVRVEDCEERAHFVDFVRKSIRGVTS